MLPDQDTILEVEGISKLYSRVQDSTRRRMAITFWHMLRGSALPSLGKLDKGEFWSLSDINFSLKRGEALGIIGFNGAGKTTLLRILSGQLLPDRGEIRMLGRSASMIDLTAGFQTSASGRRNILLRGAMLGRSQQEIAARYEEIIAFADLGDAIDAPVNTYSSGMMMRLAFSIMVAMEPDILFIDEVLAVGDFRFQQKCLARIRELRERAAFVLVSHSMNSIKLFCNRAIVLQQGRIAFEGEAEDATNFYAEMQEGNASPEEKLRQDVLKPQFHNDKAITEIEHYWCDADGKRTDKIVAGEKLCLYARFRLEEDIRNLVMAVPVWNEKGEYVTGFSTLLGAEKLTATVGAWNEYLLEVSDLAFNPGTYISNFAITDGPEFLYRDPNPALTVLQNRKRYWGMVTLPHRWRRIDSSRKEEST